MKMVPVVAVVAQDTLDRLQPLLDEHVAEVERMLAESKRWRELAERNGWTAQHLAWGLLLGSLVDA